MSSRRSAIKVNDGDLLCKNNCGFYGNPSWHYYCSVCYRNVFLKKSKETANNHTELSQNSVNSFTKFEEKRKIVVTKGSVKNMLKINRDLNQNNCDAVNSKQSFEQFLSSLRKNVSIDVAKQVKIHLDALEEAKYVKIDQHSVLVQRFYERLSERIKNDATYKSISEEVAEKLLEEVEKYLSIQIYEWAFKPNFSDDESKDLQLQKRIRSLYWITADILDASVNEENPIEKNHFDDAITAMIEMNTKLCPKDKLDCIVRCCKSVFEVINAHQRNVSTHNGSIMRLVNADDFLPSLILVLIRANPTLLHSNIQFIMRFSRPSLINSGENGYMFTNMSIAIEFINTLDHKSLNMSEQQFSDAMKGIKPPKLQLGHGGDTLSQNELSAAFNAQKTLDNNGYMLAQISEREEVLRISLFQLEDETEAYETSFFNKLESIKQDIPLQYSVDYNGDYTHDSELYQASRHHQGTLDSTIESDRSHPVT